MDAPLEGEEYQRYYEEGDWLDAKKNKTFIGDKASKSFTTEGHLAGPVSEIEFQWGTPGIGIIWVRVPQPFDARDS